MGGKQKKRWVKERKEKDDENLTIREWCKEGDREDTKSLFVSLAASNSNSSGTNFCCPHPHRTSVDNIGLWMSVHTCTHLQMQTRTRVQTVKWDDIVLRENQLSCFTSNIYLMPVTQTQADRGGQGGIDNINIEVEGKIKKRIEGKQKTINKKKKT